jgi:molybdenum cofactor biosynthesis enzyme MoaA
MVGVIRLNVSLDILDPERFAANTGIRRTAGRTPCR